MNFKKLELVGFKSFAENTSFLIETVFDTLNCKAALFAVNTLLEEKQKNIPMIEKS